MSKRLQTFVWALALLCLSAAAAEAQYTIQLLDPLDTADLGELPHITALKINDQGAAVGQAIVQLEDRVAGAAFRYTPAGGVENADPEGRFNSVGWHINDNSQIYGSDFAPRGQNSLFIFDDSGFNFVAADMDEQFQQSLDVSAINDDGVLIGTTGVWKRGRVQPYRYTPGVGWEEFSSVDSRLARNSFAELLNNAGDIVFGQDAFPIRSTFLLTAEGEFLEIGDLGGGYTRAAAMNESGHVVGTADDGDRPVAFLFTQEDGLRDVHRKGFKSSEALHVTADGTVAGTVAKKKKYETDGLFVREPDGKSKVVVKRRQIKRLARQAGFRFNSMAVHAINDSLEFVGAIYGPPPEDPFDFEFVQATAPFVYSKALGLVDLNEVLAAAGLEVVTTEAWDINGQGQILVGVHTDERRTTAILTPAE